MTARSVESSPNHRVLIHYCTCGVWASFGSGANLLSALHRRDVSLAGEWTCGPKGCRKQEEAK